MLAGTLLPVATFSFISDRADRLSWILFALLVLTLIVSFVLKREEYREKRAKRKNMPFQPKLKLDFCLFVLVAFLLELVVVVYAVWVADGEWPTISELLFLQSFSTMGGGLFTTILGSLLCAANVYMALLLNRRLLRLFKLDLGWRSVLKMIFVVVLVVVVLTFAMIFAGVETHTDAYTYSIILLAIICGLATIAFDCLIRNRKSLVVIPYLLASSFFLALAGVVIFAICAVGATLYGALWYKNHTNTKSHVGGGVIAPPAPPVAVPAPVPSSTPTSVAPKPVVPKVEEPKPSAESELPKKKVVEGL